MKKKKRRIWPWVLLVLAVLAAGGFFFMRSRLSNAVTVNYQTYTMKRGTVTRSITSSGKLEAADTLSVEAEADIKAEKVQVSLGDAVKKGDILLSYDTESIRDRIDALYTEISNLDTQLMRRTTHDAVTSPASGRVKEIYAKEGDDLESVMKEHGALALLSADDKMQVSLLTDAELTLGKTVTVTIAGVRKNGMVANRIEGGYLITIPDSNLSIGAEAVIADQGKELGAGKMEVHAPVYVYGTDGTVEKVNASVNQNVYFGAKLFTIADKPVSASYAETLRSREEKAEKIQELYALLSSPVLTSPEDGVVSAIYAEDGKALPAGTGTENPEAIQLHAGGAVKMTVAVDEIDIGVVSEGQEAVVTLDAFSGESFPATVTHISRLGTASGSITTYAVDLKIEGDDRLLEGMNGSAVITAQKKENVLLLPVAAILEDETGIYVYTMNGEEAVRKDIKTGLSDGVNAEITEGLSEGDTVRYTGSSYVGLVDRYNQMRPGFGGN